MGLGIGFGIRLGERGGFGPREMRNVRPSVELNANPGILALALVIFLKPLAKLPRTAADRRVLERQEVGRPPKGFDTDEVLGDRGGSALDLHLTDVAQERTKLLGTGKSLAFEHRPQRRGLQFPRNRTVPDSRHSLHYCIPMFFS